MGTERKLYDLIGVGVGPFNLSLAALLDTNDKVDALFFEQNEKFDWHPGMLIEGTKMQVPFLADLVTMADPTNKYSYLNYLNEHNRMHQFYFLQRLDIPRREYNDYCQWASRQIDSCLFGKRVIDVVHHEGADEHFEIEVLDLETNKQESYLSKNIVLGTGTTPSMPRKFQELPNEDVFHTSEFLLHQDRCRKAKSITVVGSGQSAAEVFRELLKEQRHYNFRLDWLTRSAGFSSMEESKLSLEHFSPDYVNYFYQLPPEKKEEIFGSQDLLYKGISNHTVTDIYNLLYEHSVGEDTLNVGLRVLTSVEDIKPIEASNGYTISCHQWQKEEDFNHDSEVIILATGYRPNVPDFVQKLDNFLCWDEKDRYIVGRDYRLKKETDSSNEIYVHSGISHTHGVGSTNLGLAIHRNKTIINHLVGKEIYPVHERHVFQQFSN